MQTDAGSGIDGQEAVSGETKQQRIERLDRITANQIAAGEVIDRPASVVKELVENAIDAGSTRIVVRFDEGGLTLIQVSDDGVGIDHRDLPLAVERHATSKLRRIEDLDDLRTLGFRGEALASIASVAAMEIETRRRGDNHGYRLRVKGDEPPSLGMVACPEGTQVMVEQLFYNTPARLKFLGRPGHEGGLIHDMMIQMALGYPRIAFRLENQGKLLFDTGRTTSHEDLVELFFGKDARRALIAVAVGASKARLDGWITAAPYSRGVRKGMHLFINGRRVVARDIQWAVERAYEHLLPKGRYPLTILTLQLPWSLLDVNVHPGKLEVRVNDPDLAPSVTRALREVLAGAARAPEKSGLGVAAQAGSHAAQSPEANRPAGLGWATPAAGGYVRFGESGPSLSIQEQLFDLVDMDMCSRRELTDTEPQERDYATRLDISDAPITPGAPIPHDPPGLSGLYSPSALPTLEALTAKARHTSPGQWGEKSHTQSLQGLAADSTAEGFSFRPETEFHVLGQLRRCFILAEVSEGLLLVDQHVAHERILFDEMSAGGSAKEAAQMLLQPLSVDLTTAQEDTLVRHILLLSELGFVLERFGPRRYLIRAEPAGQAVDESMFKDLLVQLGDTPGEGDPQETRRALLVMSACKQAVKANTVLRHEEMHTLLAALRQTRYPMICPHGRPVLILLPYKRMIRAFGRS